MSGFNDKIGVLLEKVMKTLHHLCSHPFDNSVFDTIYSKEVEMLQIQATKVGPQCVEKAKNGGLDATLYTWS